MVVHVALTGATGFLGLRLLRRLLTTHASLTVLTHARSGDALHRITRFFELSGDPDTLIAALPSRLRVVETELERPRLGLSGNDFQKLADGLDAIWHSAGSINLEDDLARLRGINVEGTRHVLELAAAGHRNPAVHHVSTAFVAGARREGVAYEDELDDTYGFENAYERSKYEAEVLVRAWSRAHDRPVLVLRPSILVTDLPPHPDLPSHPLQVIERILQDSLRTAGLAGPGIPGSSRPEIRLVGHPHGHLNLMPVEDAAEVMVRLAGRPPSGGVDTYNVVHGHDVPVSTIVALLERLVHLNLDVVARKPDDASALESLLDFYPGFTAYLSHRRRFDDTRVRTLFGPSTTGFRVDLDYLWSGLGPRPATAG
ncbi:SDR family oxidoreductase [Streptomyces sp. NPDC056708]|uniref:SDR family oxidoreductase n=1 Tax=unclassified Streptomyces TaxID=2593676 RepID=UPI0036AB12FF